MADKLKTLMGVVPRRYQVSLTGMPSATLAIPAGMASAAALAPTANVWLEVVSVAGAGRLRGAILSTAAPSGATNKMRMRVTVDGVAYVGEVTLGTSLTAYVLISEMLIGNDQICLLPEIPFSVSLKIEVLRAVAWGPMTLNYFYQLEA